MRDCPERSGAAAGGALKGGGGAERAQAVRCGPVPSGLRRSNGEASPCLPAELLPNTPSAARPLMFHRGPVSQLTHTRPPA